MANTQCVRMFGEMDARGVAILTGQKQVLEKHILEKHMLEQLMLRFFVTFTHTLVEEECHRTNIP